MSELNFSELRQAVENETNIPEFREVSRRARRHRRWRLLVNTARVFGILALTTPAIVIGDVVLSHLAHPQSPKAQAIGIGEGDADGNGDANGTGVSTASTGVPPTVTRRIIAVDGIDMAHTYALVDVCQSVYCNLQLSQVNPDPAAASTQRYGLLRTAPADVISDPRLVVENASTVVVSGVIGTAPRQYQTLSITPAAGTISSAVRPIQPVVEGSIRTVKGANGVATVLADQPPVGAPILESSTDGWWVVGTMPNGELAVSVSHDFGRKWSSHAVGVASDPSTPGGADDASLVTIDGQSVFMLVRSGAAVSLVYSNDGGATWGIRDATQSWPESGSYGLVMTTSKTLVAWFSSGATTTYLASVDLGNSFHRLTGSSAPSGQIVATGGGYETLGTSPMWSVNGSTWQAAYVPFEYLSG
jgi:hypothetical protein